MTNATNAAPTMPANVAAAFRYAMVAHAPATSPLEFSAVGYRFVVLGHDNRAPLAGVSAVRLYAVGDDADAPPAFVDGLAWPASARHAARVGAPAAWRAAAAAFGAEALPPIIAERLADALASAAVVAAWLDTLTPAQLDALADAADGWPDGWPWPDANAAEPLPPGHYVVTYADAPTDDADANAAEPLPPGHYVVTYADTPTDDAGEPRRFIVRAGDGDGAPQDTPGAGRSSWPAPTTPEP